MDRHIVIITTDERQEKLASLLGGTIRQVSWEQYRQENEVDERIYVLPTPITKIDTNREIKEKLKEELIKNNESASYVFGGAFDESWETFFEEQKIRSCDFMKLPEVVKGNAYITAEGTLAEVLRYADRSVREQKILVTGYGCCGSEIASVFARLGADVTVAARREEVREQIRFDGYKACSFGELEEIAKEADTVINTVPAMVLTEAVLSRMRSDALIVDIASRPGGTDFETAQKLGIRARLSLGLPGIYTTTSSAGLLRDAIFRYAPLQDDVREEKLWIFQIVI